MRICKNCGSALCKSNTDGYAWQCWVCDEDFCDFETIEVEEKPLAVEKIKELLSQAVENRCNYEELEYYEDVDIERLEERIVALQEVLGIAQGISESPSVGHLYEKYIEVWEDDKTRG